MVRRRRWQTLVWCASLFGVAASPLAPAVAAEREPLGYPESVGDESPTMPAFPRRADEPQVPAGLDPQRAPEHATDPDGLLAWFQEPFPASPCDRELVDPAWMGPGEYAYHTSAQHCWCSRDHTRMFRMNYMGRLWVAADLLLWSTSGNSLPGLVTSSPAGTPAAQAGVIGQPGTSILFGSDWVPGTIRPGGRITVGYWFDPRQHDGIDAQYFQLADATTTGTFTNQGGTLLGRPYVDATTGQQAAVLFPPPYTLPADASLLSRSIIATQDTSFQGFDLLFRRSLSCDLLHRRWLVGGYRFLQLNDTLGISDSSVVSSGSAPGYPLTNISSYDQFRAQTQFHGGEFGLIERWWYERWSLQVLGKMALGASIFNTDIGGSTLATQTLAAGATPTVLSNTAGSVLSQPTNIGSYGSSAFAAVGELGATIDYAIWSQCRLSVGYTAIWWSTVGRAADQIDTTVNPTQFPPGTLSGPAQPAFHQRSTDFWAQGLNLGFEYQF